MTVALTSYMSPHFGLIWVCKYHLLVLCTSYSAATRANKTEATSWL